MATPIPFLPATQINTGTAAIGGQNQPQTIGLSNGNILFLWTDFGPVGQSAGSDLVGKIFDPLGNVVRDSFQVNASFVDADEIAPSIAATNDGGWIMAFVETVGAATTSIRFERVAADGTMLGSETIATATAGVTVSDPSIAVDLRDNSFVVSYTRNISQEDIIAVPVDANGFALSNFAMARNSSDRDANSDLAILSNGDVVSVAEETDGVVVGIEFTIRTPRLGSFINNQPVEMSASRDPAVAALADGNFVVAWHALTGNVIKARVYDPAGNSVSAEIPVASGPDVRTNPDVIALPDGGFVVVWDNQTQDQIFAQAFRANGTPDGAAVTVASNNVADFDIGVTADGRLLVTWRGSSDFEIYGAVWDPRGGQIDNTVYRQNVSNFVVNAGPVVGSVLDDSIGGSNAGEVIHGLAGNDTVTALGGNDTIFGGAGDDRVFGGAGDDTLHGGSGNDTLHGGGGTDVINGDAGNDRILGAAGDDTIRGGAGDDSVGGGDGNDRINGGIGNDTLGGDGGNDSINGGDGNDSILGGEGNDRIDGGDGNDSISGDGGNDSISGGDGNDTINAGVGFDTVFGGTGADVITGLGGFDMLMGEGGFDIINGNGGNDTIFGGGGNDTIDGGIGADVLNGGIGFDVIFSRGGNDVISGLDGFDTLSGNAGNDVISGNAGNDVIVGGLGNDTIDGGIGADTLNGDAGADLISGNGGADVIIGGDGDDRLFGNSGNDRLEGGSGNDTLNGGAGADSFVFVPQAGERDVVTDFEVGVDRFLFDIDPGSAVTVMTRDVSGGVEASVLGHTVFFTGLTVAELQAVTVEFF